MKLGHLRTLEWSEGGRGGGLPVHTSAMLMQASQWTSVKSCEEASRIIITAREADVPGRYFTQEKGPSLPSMLVANNPGVQLSTET